MDKNGRAPDCARDGQKNASRREPKTYSRSISCDRQYNFTVR